MEQGNPLAAPAVVSRPTGCAADDRELVAGVRAGDDRAFELLFQRYQPRIAAYVRGMVHDHGRAEDITQEVFIAALRRMRAETEREILFKPWIFEIAKNRCIDAFRRARHASEVSFDARDAIGAEEHGRLAEPGATPDSTVEDKVAIDNLCGAFGGLSPVHHDILVLRELDGLSYREIGDRLGMSRPAVESTLFRARKRLSEEYDELVSGRRCLRVQRIVDASAGRASGLREQRRMARHLSHCQSCRRYAGRAGVDLGRVARPTAAAARVAAFLPLPAFLRRRGGAEEAIPLLGQGGPVSHWSANVAAIVDPGVVSSWSKAIATAASVAVAGVGAGAAFSDRAKLAGTVTPRSPFAQAPGAAHPGSARDPQAASPARSAKSGAIREQSGLAARRAQVRVGPSLPSGRASAVLSPVGAQADTGATAGRPAGPDASGPPATGVGAATGARRGSGAPVPGGAVGGAVGRVLSAVGAVGAGGAGGGGPGAATATASSAAAPGASALQGATAPVARGLSAVGAAAPAVESTLGDVGAVTAAAGSVSATVSETIPSTTTTPIDLGG